jgi:peptide deformylase
MSVLNVAHIGHPSLRQIAEPVDEGDLSSDSIRRLIDDLIETMREYDGVGLAAPQVRELWRIFVIEVDPANPRYAGQSGLPLLSVVNPVLTPSATRPRKDGRAACRSRVYADSLLDPRLYVFRDSIATA